MAAATRSADRLGLASGLTQRQGTDLMHAPLEPARLRPGKAVVARDGTEPRGSERPPMASPRPCGSLAGCASRTPDTVFPGPLLLVEESLADRARLQRGLTASGFAVVGAGSPSAALAAVEEAEFAYAVLELRLRGGGGLELIRRLRERHAAMRIVVATDHDSFATVVLALARRSGRLPRQAGDRRRTDGRPARSDTDVAIDPRDAARAPAHGLGAHPADPGAMRPQRDRDGATVGHADVARCSGS